MSVLHHESILETLWEEVVEEVVHHAAHLAPILSLLVAGTNLDTVQT